MKLNTAAEEVQLLVTLALVQGFQVVVVPTVIVAALQVAQVSHFNVVLAFANVTVLPSVSPNTISSPLKLAEFILAQVGHIGHCGQVRVVLAFANVTVFPSVSPNCISSQLNDAEFILAQVSHFSHLRLEY